MANYGEVKIFCCLLGVSGFCVQGGDPTGTGMGKLTLKKKITTNTKHVQTSHYKINRYNQYLFEKGLYEC